MKTFYLENEPLHFLEGIVARNTPVRPMTVRTLSSRNLIPTDWNDTEFDLEYADREVRINFRRPVNDPHFRVDLAGDVPDTLVFNFRVHAGIEESALAPFLKSRRIIFLGCARNCEKHVKASILALSNLGAHFKDWRIGVFENDSTDSTHQALSRLSGRFGLTVLRESGVDEHIPLRTARIAYGRNQLLSWARTQGPADYLCFADLDGIVNQDLSVEGFLSSFRYEAVWDGVFPVNDDFCYDIYTVRQKDIAARDYRKAMEAVDASIGKDLARWLEGHSKLLDLRGMAGWLPVNSAFGGMGLYKYRAIIDGRYVGLDSGNDEVCDHVSVNENIVRRGGRLYINPEFVVVPFADPEDWKGAVAGGYWNSRHWRRRQD